MISLNSELWQTHCSELLSLSLCLICFGWMRHFTDVAESVDTWYRETAVFRIRSDLVSRSTRFPHCLRQNQIITTEPQTAPVLSGDVPPAVRFSSSLRCSGGSGSGLICISPNSAQFSLSSWFFFRGDFNSDCHVRCDWTLFCFCLVLGSVFLWCPERSAPVSPSCWRCSVSLYLLPHLFSSVSCPHGVRIKVCSKHHYSQFIKGNQPFCSGAFL